MRVNEHGSEFDVGKKKDENEDFEMKKDKCHKSLRLDKS